MNAKTARTDPTSHDLQRGRAAAENELQQAREEHARAAYAHAVNRDDPAARERVLAIKRRMDLLQSEMQGLDAATGEATRIEQIDALEAHIQGLNGQRTDALRAVAAADTAFGRVAGVIKELHEAHAALEAAESRANNLESRCAQLPHVHGFYSQSHRNHALIDGLLWWAVGERNLSRSEVVMDVGGHVNVDNAAHQYKRQGERAKTAISEGIERKIDSAKADAAVLVAKGQGGSRV